MSEDRKELAKKLYLEGKTRKEAMKLLGIASNHVMSGLSSSLGLHWGWPLSNRRSGQEPVKMPKKVRPRSEPKLKPPLAVSKELQRQLDAVQIKPIELDLSPAALAPHLYGARPYQKGDEEEKFENTLRRR